MSGTSVATYMLMQRHRSQFYIWSKNVIKEKCGVDCEHRVILILLHQHFYTLIDIATITNC